MVSTLITVAVIAWCAQLALGGWQISRFNRAFDKLSQQGRVASGAPAGVLSPGGGCRGAGRTAAGDGHFIDERPYGIRQTG